MVSRNFSRSDAWLQSTVFAILWAVMLSIQISNMLMLRTMNIQYSTHLGEELREDRDINPKLLKELADIKAEIVKVQGRQDGIELLQSKGLFESNSK